MAKPRIPGMKADITGSTLKNPARYKGRTIPGGTNAIGDPPETLDDAQAGAWHAFVRELPWLDSSHRALLHIASLLRARLHTDPAMGVNAMQTLSAILSKLGASPVDRSKVLMRDQEDTDPAARFFN